MGKYEKPSYSATQGFYLVGDSRSSIAPTPRNPDLKDGQTYDPAIYAELDRLRSDRAKLIALARRVGRYVAPGICNECRDETCDAALLSTCLGWDARRLLRLLGEEATHADDDGPTPTR